MANADVYNLNKDVVGSIELDDAVFAGEVKEHLFWEVVRSQQASRRAGTHSTKTRAEVHGTNNKPWRQKGTGRARHGDRKGNIFVGGGIAFGPKPRDYSYNPPKKVRKAAVRSALARRLEEGKLWIFEDMDLGEIKTKKVAALADTFGWKNALLVDERNESLQKSAKNLTNVQYLCREGLNCYDILRYEHIAISKAAVAEITGALKK